MRREKVRIGKGLFRRICRRHAHRERLAVRQLAGSREVETLHAFPAVLEADRHVSLQLLAAEAAIDFVGIGAVERDIAREAVLAQDAGTEGCVATAHQTGGLQREHLERGLRRRDAQRVVVVLAAETRLVRHRHAVLAGLLEGVDARRIALCLRDAALVQHELLDDRQVVAAHVLLRVETTGTVVPGLQQRRNRERQVTHRTVELQHAIKRGTLTAGVKLEVPRSRFLNREIVAIHTSRHVDGALADDHVRRRLRRDERRRLRIALERTVLRRVERTIRLRVAAEDRVLEVRSTAEEVVVDLQRVEAVLGNLVCEHRVGQIVEVVRKRHFLPTRVVETEHGIEEARHRVAQVREEFARDRGADQLLAFLETEHVGIRLARPDLSVQVDRERLRLDVRRQVQHARQRDVLVAGREHEERFVDVRLLRDVERMGRTCAVAIVQEDVAATGLRVRIHLHVEDEQVVERGRILRIALGRVEVAGDDLELKVVQGIQVEPPVALLPVRFLEGRLGRELAVFRGLHLALDDVVQPVAHKRALRPARGTGESRHGNNARDLHAFAGDPGALHAANEVATHDDTGLGAHLHARRMIVAGLGNGKGGGGDEPRDRDNCTADIRHRFPSDAHIRTWWPDSSPGRIPSATWGWANGRRDRRPRAP